MSDGNKKWLTWWGLVSSLSLPAVWLTVLSGHNGRPSKNRPYKYSTFLSRQQLVPGCAEAICNCFSRPGFEKLSLHQRGEGCGVVLIIVSFHSGKLLQINAKILCCGSQEVGKDSRGNECFKKTHTRQSLLDDIPSARRKP